MAFLGAISLWRLDRRAEADALLAEVRPDLAADSWPLVVMDFVQGKLAADRFLSKARDVEQQTEAHAYVGFKLLHEGRRNEALTHLRWVKERGTSAFVEHGMAVAELKRLEKIAGAV
jgi:lipoprotein NlpI